MKKFICLTIIAISLASCETRDSRRPISSAYNYCNSVVVDKNRTNSSSGPVYLFTLRVEKDKTYTINTLRVAKGEYEQFAIGDTIK